MLYIPFDSTSYCTDKIRAGSLPKTNANARRHVLVRSC
jgi:hypothetical protein